MLSMNLNTINKFFSFFLRLIDMRKPANPVNPSRSQEASAPVESSPKLDWSKARRIPLPVANSAHEAFEDEDDYTEGYDDGYDDGYIQGARKANEAMLPYTLVDYTKRHITPNSRVLVATSQGLYYAHPEKAVDNYLRNAYLKSPN